MGWARTEDPATGRTPYFHEHLAEITLRGAFVPKRRHVIRNKRNGGRPFGCGRHTSRYPRDGDVAARRGA